MKIQKFDGRDAIMDGRKYQIILILSLGIHLSKVKLVLQPIKNFFDTIPPVRASNSKTTIDFITI